MSGILVQRHLIVMYRMNKLVIILLLTVLVVPLEVMAVSHPVFGPKTTALRTTAGTRFLPLFGGALNDTNTFRMNVAVGGTVSDLTAQVTNAPGSGNSYVVSLYKNGSVTGLTCTIADAATSCTDTTNSVAVVTGDDLNWSAQTVGTTGSSQITIAGAFEAHSTADGLIGGVTGATTNTDGYYGLMGGSASTTESAVSMIAPTAFVLDQLFCRVSNAPAAGNTFAYTVYHNGSPTSLGCSIADTNTSANDLTDSVSVAAGDTVSVFFDASGSPTARYQTWSMRVQPTTAGEYPLMSTSVGVISTGLTQYANPFLTGAGFTNESTGLRVAPLAFTWRKLYAFFNPAPGSGKSWTLVSRKNTADGNQSAVVSNTSQTNQDSTNSDSIAQGDSIALKTTPSGTPSTVLLSKFSSVSYVAPPSPALLLDTIVPPLFAFSLSRYLRAAEVGNPVVRLREDATDTELDFKLNGSNVLVSDDVNEDTVSDWLTANSATTAYVVYVYDQSGNGETMGTTTTTHQPILRVNSNLNNLAAVDFSGNANARLEGNWSMTAANGIEIHGIATPEGTIGTSDRFFFSNSATSLSYAGLDSTNGWYWQSDFGTLLASSNAAVSGTDYQLSYRYVGSDTFTIDVNCTEVLNSVSGVAIDWRSGDQVIGNSGYTAGDQPWNGLIAELIFYNGLYSSGDLDDIQQSMATQAGVSGCSPAPSLSQYRIYNIGQMLLNRGSLIIP